MFLELGDQLWSQNGLGFDFTISDLLDLLPVHYYVEDLIMNTCPRIKQYQGISYLGSVASDALAAGTSLVHNLLPNSHSQEENISDGWTK